MRLKIHNPNKKSAPNHAVEVEVDSEIDGALWLIQNGPKVGFYPEEIKQLYDEIVAKDYSHVEVIEA